MSAAARGLQNARPAIADRAQRLEHLGHKWRRSLEITEVASHPECPSSRAARGRVVRIPDP